MTTLRHRLLIGLLVTAYCLTPVAIVCCERVKTYYLTHVDHRLSREDILYRVDHTAILMACRQVMDEYPILHDDPHSRGISFRGDDPRLPTALRDLRPLEVVRFKDRVLVEISGGFEHYGLNGYPEGVKEGETYPIMDGLWYYTD